MKQKLKKLKFLLTLSLLGLLLFSCTKDEDNSVLDSKGVFHKQYSDILKEEKFANAVSKLTNNSTQNSASAKSYSSSQNVTTLENQFGFTIANQEVNVAINDTLTSYTMLINREVEIPNEFENLIILIDNNSNTTAFVLKYSDNVPVSYTNLQNQSSQKQILSTNFVYCVEYQVWVCNYPGHTESGVCTHGHWETFSICSSSGGSSSGTSGTGGAGSSSNSSTNTSPIPTATVLPKAPLLENDPCASLSKLADPAPDGQNIKNDMDWLRLNTNNPNTNNVEYGVEFKNSIGYDNNMHYTNTQVTSPNNLNAPIFKGPLNTGGAHTHPNNGYQMFSYGDLKFLVDAYDEANASHKDQVTLILVCPNDPVTNAPITYAIKVNDFQTLYNQVYGIWNSATYAVSPSGNQINDDEKKMKKIHDAQSIRYGQSGGDLEKCFLQQYGGLGFSLHKATDDTMTNWDTLEIAKTLATPTAPLTVNKIPCN